MNEIVSSNLIDAIVYHRIDFIRQLVQLQNIEFSDNLENVHNRIVCLSQFKSIYTLFFKKKILRYHHQVISILSFTYTHFVICFFTLSKVERLKVLEKIKVCIKSPNSNSIKDEEEKNHLYTHANASKINNAASVHIFDKINRKYVCKIYIEKKTKIIIEKSKSGRWSTLDYYVNDDETTAKASKDCRRNHILSFSP